MNNRPIGIFDSGLGGLTVMAAIKKYLPKENIIYFGDTARVPYGSKSKEAVTNFSREIVDFLISKNVKMIIVACNTASAFALQDLKKKVKIPIIGVIEPGVRAALKKSDGRIGVIGTEGTINSSSYTKAINKFGKKIKVYTKACPLFVPLVEEGWVNHSITSQVIKEYLQSLKKKGVDTIVLGCTHYPILKNAIKKIMGSRVHVIDSATAVAAETAQILNKNNISNKKQNRGKQMFFVSDMPNKFKILAKRFLGSTQFFPVKKIVLKG